jgi:hypothetical protein
MTKPPIPDGDETRAGFRSGEGADSVLRHLMAAARRMKKRRNEVPDSRGPSRESEAGDSTVDIRLPP